MVHELPNHDITQSSRGENEAILSSLQAALQEVRCDIDHEGNVY